MGWFSDVFDDAGDIFTALGTTVAGAGIGFVTGGPLGAVIGGVSGLLSGMGANSMQAQQEKAQEAQVAAAREAAAAVDPSRVVQAATAAPQIEQQKQINEINNATAKAKKFALSKTTYQTGLSSFSSFGGKGQTLGNSSTYGNGKMTLG